MIQAEKAHSTLLRVTQAANAREKRYDEESLDIWASFKFARRKAGPTVHPKYSRLSRRVHQRQHEPRTYKPYSHLVSTLSRFGLSILSNRIFSSSFFYGPLNDSCSPSVDAGTGSCEQTATILEPALCCPL
jgi:hypothetical protein